MLRERPALILPLCHEEQIDGHGLAVPAPHNTTLEESQQTYREGTPPHQSHRKCTVTFAAVQLISISFFLYFKLNYQQVDWLQQMYFIHTCYSFINKFLSGSKMHKNKYRQKQNSYTLSISERAAMSVHTTTDKCPGCVFKIWCKFM